MKDTAYPTDATPKPDAARWYAEQGYLVLPLHDVESGRCSCALGRKGEDCKDAGKHPRNLHGVRGATSDLDVVAGWWETFPHANIGVATGHPFAFVVDEDVPGALDAGWDVELSDVAWPTPDAMQGTQSTPHGRHYLFDPAEGFGSSTGGRGRSLGPGIDTRGEGGYIVVAPSVTLSGRYAWRSSPIGPWPALPGPMVEALRPAPRQPVAAPVPAAGSEDDERIARYVRAAVDGACRDLLAAPEGTRNHALNELAFRLGTIGAHGVLAESTAFAAIGDAWDTAWQHAVGPDGRPSQWSSFHKTWSSGWEAGTGRPREPWPPIDRPALPDVGFALPPGTVTAALAAAATAQSWPAIDWAELFAGEPAPPEWMPGDLLERGQQVALVGSGKVGKSLFSQDWAVALVNGRPFIGAVERPAVRVVYFDHENNTRELRRNLESLGHGPEDLAGFAYLSFPMTGPLDTPRGAANFLAAVDEHRADVVFLDTVSRVISGKENDADTWLDLYRLALAPLKARGIAVVRLDHFGKDDSLGARGSVAKSQDVDHVFELTKTGGTGADIWLRLRRSHSRTGLGRDEVMLVRHGEKDDETGWLASKTSHKVPSTAFAPDAWIVRNTIAAALDADEVPRDAGRRVIRAWLTKNSQRLSDDGIRELIEYRRQQPDEDGSE